MGRALDHDRASGARRRCSAICRKPGGGRRRTCATPDDPRRSHTRAEDRRPDRRSTTCSAAPPRAGPMRSRSPIRPTAPTSPTAPPRRLTYAEADRAISRDRRAAAQARPADRRHRRHSSLPNTVESVLDHPRRAARRHDRRAAAAAVAARRDGASARPRSAPKPSSPRRASATSMPAPVAMQVAADVFPIRHVCGFGAGSAGRRHPVRRPAGRHRPPSRRRRDRARRRPGGCTSRW